jgi:hypothetical protein
MSERWLPVVDGPGYEVSDFGRVRSVDRVIVDTLGRSRPWPGVVLQPGTHPAGHKLVQLGRGRMRYVHVLVLEAFIGPCPPGRESCHWDDDPANNRVGNLRWGTRSDNRNDSVRNGGHAGTRKTRCVRGHPLIASNLIPNRRARACWACNRARSQRERALFTGAGFVPDLAPLADALYAELTSGDTQ